MAVEPGAKIHAPDTHVLALADSGEVAAAYRLVDIASGESQFGGNFWDGEEPIAGVTDGLAHGRRGHPEHPSPQGGPELLEGAEKRRHVVDLEVDDPPWIGDHEREVRLPVHGRQVADPLRFRGRFVSMPGAGRAQGYACPRNARSPARSLA